MVQRHVERTIEASPERVFDWVTTYTIPARAGGKLMEAITQPLMRSVFGAILAGCAKRLEN